MKRIESRLKELSKGNQKAFVGYIVAGDPDLETSLDLSNSEVDLSLFNYTKNKFSTHFFFQKNLSTQ